MKNSAKITFFLRFVGNWRDLLFFIVRQAQITQICWKFAFSCSIATYMRTPHPSYTLGFFCFFLMLLLAFGQSGCQKDQIPPTGQVVFRFENTAAGNVLEYGKIQYRNTIGNLFSVNALKYYVSDFELVAEDGRSYEHHNCDLIDVFDPESLVVRADSVPNGRYAKMRFYVGIDSVRNFTDKQKGDLDPLYGMLWSWTSGYIFYKHEGRFVNTAGDTLNLIYHLGNNPARTAVEIPLTNFEVKANEQPLTLRFDVSELYGAFDMEEVGAAHSSGELKDQQWTALLKEGFPRAFKIVPQ